MPAIPAPIIIVSYFILVLSVMQIYKYLVGGEAL
jgi:hypothetical protein